MAQLKVISEKYDIKEKSFEFKTELSCFDVRSGCYKVPEGDKMITNDILREGLKFKMSYNQSMTLTLEILGVTIDECPVDVLIVQESEGIIKSIIIKSPNQTTISCKYSFKIPTIFKIKVIFSHSNNIFVSKCKKFSQHNYSHLFIHDRSNMNPTMSMFSPSGNLMKPKIEDEDNYADVEFIVEKRSIKCHKVILSSKSSVFQTLFWSKSHLNQSNPSANGASSMTRVEVPDISYDAFYLFIKSLYSGTLETTTLKDSLEILRLSHKYNIIDLKKAAIEFIEELEHEANTPNGTNGHNS